MQTIRVELADRSYSVTIGSGILGTSTPAIKVPVGSAALIVSNKTVAPLYLKALMDSLAGVQVRTLILPDGEQFKTLEYWSRIVNKLVEIRATRDVTLLTLGGGVVGDMGGFAAACYMRGVRFIQIPTSLLAQVDASVGGKTGFNHPHGKNLVGAFHQPASVLIDIDTLKTLPEREFSAGMAEVIKIAAIRDAEFLDWLENNRAGINARKPETLINMITRSIQNKADVVSEDEREAGVRALLNFGHSFAHALETLTDYKTYLHGEAVAIGMMVATRLSEQRSLCTPGFSDRLGKLLQSFGLPVDMPDNSHPEHILELMKLDKKVIAGSYRLILLKAVGKGIIDSNSSNEQIAAAIVASQSQ
jgi:3-dehydroquinate synthase